MGVIISFFNSTHADHDLHRKHPEISQLTAENARWVIVLSEILLITLYHRLMDPEQCEKCSLDYTLSVYNYTIGCIHAIVPS